MEGDRITKVRRRLGWTQDTLAEFLGLPDPTYVGALEHGRKGMHRLTRRCFEALEQVSLRVRPEARGSLRRRSREVELEWFIRVFAAGQAAPSDLRGEAHP